MSLAESLFSPPEKRTGSSSGVSHEVGLMLSCGKNIVDSDPAEKEGSVRKFYVQFEPYRVL